MCIDQYIYTNSNKNRIILFQSFYTKWFCIENGPCDSLRIALHKYARGFKAEIPVNAHERDF